MFPATTKEMEIASLKQQILCARSNISVAKHRLLQLLLEDTNSGTEFSYGMAPGGATSHFDCSYTAEVIRTEAALIETLESELLRKIKD